MNDNQNDTYTLGELEAKYPHQWLAVKVVERDDCEQPFRVKILTRQVDVFSVRDKAGSNDFCTMYTGSVPEVKHVGMF